MGAHRFLREQASKLSPREAAGAAIVGRRLREPGTAATLFDIAGTLILDDPRALLESAQNKQRLAGQAHRDGRAARNQELLRDARVLMERLLRMEPPRRRLAWGWRELALARRWLGEPAVAVDEAYEMATELAPDETRFWTEWGRFSERGAVAQLVWQQPKVRGLSAPESLPGPRIMGDAENDRQNKTEEAVDRAVEELGAVLASAIKAPDHRTRRIRKHLADAHARIQDSGPLRIATGLEVARDLTEVIVSSTDHKEGLSADESTAVGFTELAQALAEVNARFLRWLGPRRT